MNISIYYLTLRNIDLTFDRYILGVILVASIGVRNGFGRILNMTILKNLKAFHKGDL
jgi:hypothetical protein